MRYLLFGGMIHYPAGGANDYIAGSEFYEVLVQWGKVSYNNGQVEWYHIYDTEEEKILGGTKWQGVDADPLPDDLDLYHLEDLL